MCYCEFCPANAVYGVGYTKHFSILFSDSKKFKKRKREDESEYFDDDTEGAEAGNFSHPFIRVQQFQV